MSRLKENSFGERLNTARNAKQAMAAKFLQRPGLDDPAFAERQAARAAVSAARGLRIAEREAERVAANERIAAEREAQAQAAAAAEAAATERAAAEQAAAAAALEVERKAARDARYAARKARR